MKYWISLCSISRTTCHAKVLISADDMLASEGFLYAAKFDPCMTSLAIDGTAGQCSLIYMAVITVRNINV